MTRKRKEETEVTKVEERGQIKNFRERERPHLLARIIDPRHSERDGPLGFHDDFEGPEIVRIHQERRFHRLKDFVEGLKKLRLVSILLLHVLDKSIDLQRIGAFLPYRLAYTHEEDGREAKKKQKERKERKKDEAGLRG